MFIRILSWLRVPYSIDNGDPKSLQFFGNPAGAVLPAATDSTAYAPLNCDVLDISMRLG